MTKFRLLLTIIIVCNLLTAAADNLGYSKYQPLVIGMDLDYAPLEYVDKDGLPQGLDVKLTQELMKRLDVPYTYQPNTWENISGDVISGRVDLGMMVYSPYRQDSVNYSRAVFRLYYQVVYRNTNTDQFDMRHIANKEIAYMSSRPITDTLTKAGAILHVVRDLPKAFRELSGGKYDAIICFRYQAKYHITNMELDNLVAEDLTLTPREYCYVSIHRNLIRAIDQELVKMEKEGIIDDIYGDYISRLGIFTIPHWVWWLLSLSVLLVLTILLIQQRRHSRRLHQEMRRAQKSEQLKGVFLANVSHALRTPLNAIIGFSDILRSMPAEALTAEEHEEMLTQIYGNGQQLLYFINELLELSNIEGNGIEFHRVDADVFQLLNEYVLTCKPQVAEGVDITVSKGPFLTAHIDTNMLRTVTMHLLSNAIRHTSQGSINISYEARNKGLYVAVKDTGTGLSDKLRDNIFALLNNKHTYTQEQTPGLGLSICKSIMDAVHGKIGAESEPGKGAMFWFWVPCYCRDAAM